MSRVGLGLLLALSGCSLLFSPDESSDPTGDCPAGAPTEIDPVAPMVINEGTGTGGAPPALVVFTGCNIPADFEVGTSSPMLSLKLGGVAADGSMAVLGIAADIVGDLRDQNTEMVTVDFGEGSSFQVTVNGLDEFPGLATISSGDLRPLYSRIEIQASTVLEGNEAIQLQAVGGVIIDSQLDATGEDDGTRPGPGGCPGGSSGLRGGCDPSGGGGGKPSQAGAGAGHREPGGGENGSGGMPSGHETLLAVAGFDEARGHGGGGGGAAVSSAVAGGAGGGGGGVVSVITNGDIRFGTNGSIDVSGGDGAGVAEVACNSSNDVPGPGGGGSGGAVFLHGAAVTIGRPEAVVLDGGRGGTGPCVTIIGGDGSPGRVRIDALSLDAAGAALVAAEEGYLAPGLSIPEPVITGPAMVDLDWVGLDGTPYWLEVNGGSPTQMPMATTIPVTIELEPGINRLCTFVEDPGPDDGPPASSVANRGRCQEVVYIPELAP